MLGAGPVRSALEWHTISPSPPRLFPSLVSVALARLQCEWDHYYSRWSALWRTRLATRSCHARTRPSCRHRDRPTTSLANSHRKAELCKIFKIQECHYFCAIDAVMSFLQTEYFLQKLNRGFTTEQKTLLAQVPENFISKLAKSQSIQKRSAQGRYDCRFAPKLQMLRTEPTGPGGDQVPTLVMVTALGAAAASTQWRSTSSNWAGTSSSPPKWSSSGRTASNIAGRSLSHCTLHNWPVGLRNPKLKPACQGLSMYRTHQWNRAESNGITLNQFCSHPYAVTGAFLRWKLLFDNISSYCFDRKFGFTMGYGCSKCTANSNETQTKPKQYLWVKIFWWMSSYL